MPREHDGADGAVTVRYWAAARAAAGVDEDVVGGCTTVGEAVLAAGRLRPSLVAVAAVSSFLLDGRAARGDEPLTAGAVLEVLPPFAGG